MIDIVIHVERGTRWLRLQRPARVIDVRAEANLDHALREIEQLGRTHGYHAAGFITYEAGRAYGMQTCEPEATLPLAWFALFDDASVEEIAEPVASSRYGVAALAPSVDRAGFDSVFIKIRQYIAEGDTYQVNYTFDLRGRFTGDAFSLFADLAATQRGQYAATFTPARTRSARLRPSCSSRARTGSSRPGR